MGEGRIFYFEPKREGLRREVGFGAIVNDLSWYRSGAELTY